MASKKVKRKNKAISKANQSQYLGESYSPNKSYVGGYYYGANQASPDMRADETGVALAYTFNVAVSAAINFWELWLDGIEWRLCREADDSEVLNSTMRRVPEHAEGAKFFNAIKFHEQYFKHSLWKSIAFSDNLYGESYLHFLCNEWGMADKLEWVNPLAIEPMIMMGRISDYRYNNAEGYETIKPRNMAYRIAKRDPRNDLRGMPRVLSAIDELNLAANQKRAFKSYFRNNMQLGGVISPTGNDTSLAPNQIMKMEDDLERNNKGAVNAGKWVIAPTNMNITPFPANDMEKNYAIDKPLQDKILMAMGVYPQLAGDPSDANYDSAYDIKRQWWESFGIPYAKEIMGYINNQILPVLEPYSGIYFEYDFTPYEVEKPEVIEADLSAGMIDLYTAQEKRGYEGDEDLKGIYIINNVPMSKAIIKQLANTIPSQYALDYANAATAGTPANTNADTSLGLAKPIAPSVPALPSGKTPATQGSEITPPYLTSKAADSQALYSYLDLSNRDELLSITKQLKQAMGNSAIEWESSDTWHVTLCYVPSIDPSQDEFYFNRLTEPKLPFNIRILGLGMFNNPDSRALHLIVEHNPQMDKAQATIADNYVDEISSYSQPEQWQPHITLAYLPQGVVMPNLPIAPFEMAVDRIVWSRDSYKEVYSIGESQPIIGKSLLDKLQDKPNLFDRIHEHTHDLPEITDTQADALEELSAWKKFVTNGKSQKRPFSPVALRGDLGDMLALAVESHDKQIILDAFHSAQEKLSIKAIQETRLDFENDFDTLLTRARSEKMGRVQWASSMRAIIRRYGYKAYIDGMADGGVEESPSEDDLAQISDLASSNSQYVTELGGVLYKSDTELSDGQADIKAAMWWNKSLQPFYDAGLFSADANGLYEWVYGDTEHCDSCIKLNGQRHRLKGWKANIMPKSDELLCKGFSCQCLLTKASGRARGSYLS